MGLLQVPAEIIRLIVRHLKPEDLLHLAASSSHLQNLLWDQHTCWNALKEHRFSIEYEDAVRTGDFARGLRRLAKRRNAVQTAKPFQIVQIASASHFIYSHGAVCYTPDRHHLRVLQLRDSLLRNPVSKELVIDIRGLLAFTVFPIMGFLKSSDYTFKPIHHAHNILSCLYSRADRPCWRNFLIVIDLEKRRVINQTIVTDPNELFVRNSDKYLYYGTKPETRDSQRERWMLQGLDLGRGTWLSARLILRDFVGTEIGSAVSFEIFDDYLYCVTNQRLLEPAEAVQDSFYYALRFHVGDVSSDLRIKSLQKLVLWRRRADEGLADERWNSLQLSKDEQSGKIFVIETRKEFSTAVSQSLRTCYKRELIFPDPVTDLATPSLTDDEDDPEDLLESVHEEESDDPGDLENLEGPDDSDDALHFSDPIVSDFGRAREANPVETEPLELLHYGDEESSPITFTYHQTLVKSYNASCQTFVDIVNNPTVSEPIKKRLRLRSRPQLSGTQPRSVSYVQELLRSNRDMEVKFWPDPADPGSDAVYEILNPPIEFDRADSAMDERFLVYSPRSYDSDCEESPLILVSFDPALHLLGLPGLYTSASHYYDNPASASARCDPSSAASYYSFGDQDSSDGPCSDSEFAALMADSAPPPTPGWIKKRIATYITQVKDGAVRGFDLSRGPCRSSAN